MQRKSAINHNQNMSLTGIVLDPKAMDLDQNSSAF